MKSKVRGEKKSKESCSSTKKKAKAFYKELLYTPTREGLPLSVSESAAIFAAGMFARQQH